MSRENINVFTDRGIALTSVLFKSGNADTVLIAITGIYQKNFMMYMRVWQLVV